jgi:hypothetical protein
MSVDNSQRPKPRRDDDAINPYRLNTGRRFLYFSHDIALPFDGQIRCKKPVVSVRWSADAANIERFRSLAEAAILSGGSCSKMPRGKAWRPPEPDRLIF